MSSSRRALLAGAIGGLGAWVAGAIGLARPARAADGQPLVVGVTNDSTNVTLLGTNSPTNSAFQAQAAGGDAIRALAAGGAGVYGYSLFDRGVWGDAGANGIGVMGFSHSDYKPGLVGWSGNHNTGVQGFSNDGVLGTLPAAPARTGVYGYAAQDASAVGVRGESQEGIGVLGLATGGGTAAFGLFARSNSSDAPAIGARSAGNSTAVVAKSGSGSFPTAKAKTGVYGEAAQDSTSKGVWGHSPTGRGIQGSTSTGYAGYFSGKVFTNRYYELAETTTPPTAGTDRARVFVRDNGAGKTQLCVRFQTGAVKVLATET